MDSISENEMERIQSGSFYEECDKEIETVMESIKTEVCKQTEICELKDNGNPLFVDMCKRSQNEVHGPMYRKKNKNKHLWYEKIRPTVNVLKTRRWDAGYDIINDVKIVFAPHEQKKIALGIAVSIPANFYGQLCFTSSFSKDHQFVLTGNVIDSGYTGELFANVISLSDEVQIWEPNTRVLQLVLPRVYTKWPRCVESGIYESTSRGFR